MRQKLADAGCALAEERCIRPARATLAAFLGGTVRVCPLPDRTYLIAPVGLTPMPLVRAAGSTVDKVVAGGGTLPEYSTAAGGLIPRLVRPAEVARRYRSKQSHCADCPAAPRARVSRLRILAV